MRLVSDDAIILDIKENKFKGRDGKEVVFKQVRIVDDTNDVHNVTVPSDFQAPDGVDDLLNVNRLSCRVVIDVSENDKKLRKRLVSIE